MARINPANTEAEDLLKIQSDKINSDRSRCVYGILLIIVMLCIIILLGSFVWLFQRSGFSENENRFLAETPDFSKESLVNGKFTKELADFMSDSFPFREKFIELRANSEKLLQKNEVNGVLVGQNGVLTERPDLSKVKFENLNETEGAINIISENFERSGIKTTVAIVPFAAEMHEEYLPSLFSVNPLKIDAKNAVYLRDALDGEADIWFKTDHHWTAYGAYLAYVYLSDELGYTPYKIEKFTKVTVSNDFYGTTYSKSGLYSTPPDSITLLRYSGDERFYDLSALDKKDKYAVFLGGNHAHLTVETNETKPRLLIIKDSYANAIVPFLAIHFELEIVDPRYFSGDVYKIAEKCDAALFLYGSSSLLTDTDLIRLTLTQ